MVFGSADGPLCRESAVVLRGGVLEGDEDGAKKGGKIGGGLIVNHEEGKRVREGFEKGDDRREGGDVRGGGAGFERCEVNVPVVNGNEYVSKSRHFQPTPVQTIDKTIKTVDRCEEVRKKGCEEREHET